jgi:hypothetical protein
VSDTPPFLLGVSTPFWKYHGTELTSKLMQKWSEEHCVELMFIQPGKPTQNAYIESFNSRVRAELLNAHWFRSMLEARTAAAEWRKAYHTITRTARSDTWHLRSSSQTTKSRQLYRNHWPRNGADPACGIAVGLSRIRSLRMSCQVVSHRGDFFYFPLIGRVYLREFRRRTTMGWTDAAMVDASCEKTDQLQQQMDDHVAAIEN